MNLVDKAIIFATKAFEGKERKVRPLPSILHSLEVGCIVSSLTSNEEVIAAGILHDVVEDASISLNTLKEEFVENVTEEMERWMFLKKENDMNQVKLCPLIGKIQGEYPADYIGGKEDEQ